MYECIYVTGKKKQHTVEQSERSIPGQKISAAQTFTFRQMANATNNFSIDNLVGEGGFGRVYKGFLQGVDKVINMLLSLFYQWQILNSFTRGR